MKKLILFALLILINVSCNKRSCQCEDDIILIDDNNISGLDFDLEVPNAVLNIGSYPLVFKLNTTKEVDWTQQRIKLYKGNNVYLETTDLSEFVSSSSLLTFPHETFTLDNGDPFSGPLEIELDITTKANETVSIEGTIYFYQCEDLQEGFGAEDCRWPSQIIGYTIEPPC